MFGRATGSVSRIGGDAESAFAEAAATVRRHRSKLSSLIYSRRLEVALKGVKVINEEGVQPRQLVRAWVEAFNRADVEALADFYTEDAVNHQVPERAALGRSAIREMFAAGFAAANMTCLIENIFQDGDWAILEWRDPSGLRGCGFFHVVGGKIVFQRGYWDKLTFLAAQGLPRPDGL